MRTKEELTKFFLEKFEEGKYYVVEVAATDKSPIQRAIFCITSKKNKVGLIYYGGKGFPNLVKVEYESLAYLVLVEEVLSLSQDFPDKGRFPEEV